MSPEEANSSTNGAVLAAGRQPRVESREQALGQMSIRTLGERPYHCAGQVRADQHIARGDSIDVGMVAMAPQRTLATVRCRAALPIDGGQLPIGSRITRARDEPGDRVLRREAAREKVQPGRAEPGIRDVLGSDRSRARPGMGAARRNRGAGLGNGHPKHASARATRSDRKGHAGMTAVASISTSHSGRARALTTRPVDTGNTPFSQPPISR